MRQGKDRAIAALVKAFAAQQGCSLRTAQRHCSAESEEWRRFSQGQLLDSVRRSGAAPVARAGVDHPPAPPSDDAGPPMGSSEPERLVRQCWEMWHWHYETWRHFAVAKDDALTLSHAAACVKLRESYEKALAKFQQWEIEQRRLIPVNEFAAMRSEFVIPLANFLGNLPAELGPQVNPQNPGHAMNRIAEYLQQRLQPAIKRLLDNLEAYDAGRPAAA